VRKQSNVIQAAQVSAPGKPVVTPDLGGLMAEYREVSKHPAVPGAMKRMQELQLKIRQAEESGG